MRQHGGQARRPSIPNRTGDAEHTLDTVAALAVENLFDRYYFNYLDAQTAPIPARGLTVKGSLRIRFSDRTVNG